MENMASPKETFRRIARYFAIFFAFFAARQIYWLWSSLSSDDKRFWCLSSSPYYTYGSIRGIALLSTVFLIFLTFGFGKSKKFFLGSMFMILASLFVVARQIVPGLFASHC